MIINDLIDDALKIKHNTSLLTAATTSAPGSVKAWQELSIPIRLSNQ